MRNKGKPLLYLITLVIILASSVYCSFLSAINEAPVYHCAVKVGDWAEYLVDEAVNATILCNSNVNPDYNIPLTTGDVVRITITEISEELGYATYMNGSIIYYNNIPTLSVSLNGVEIRTNMLNLIPFFSGSIGMFNLEAIHPTKGEGYWDSYDKRMEYISSIYSGYISDFNFTLNDDRAFIHCTLFRWDELNIVVSKSLGVPIEISGYRNQTINKYLPNGRYHVKLTSTNIMGLIGPPRPHEVSIMPSVEGEVSTTSALINWSQSTDNNFTKYELYMDTVRLGTDLGELLVTINDRSETSYEVNGLDSASSYYFTVRVFTPYCYADSETVRVTTLGTSLDSPVRFAKVMITNPESINQTNPFIINMRSDLGVKLSFRDIKNVCTIDVYNITKAPPEMRPEPWTLDEYGRMKTLGNIIQVTTSGSANFISDIDLYVKKSTLEAYGIDYYQLLSAYAMRLYGWDNTTKIWKDPNNGGFGSGGYIDSIFASTTIYEPNYYTIIFRLPATPVTLSTPTLDDITSSSIKLSWSQNNDPDFLSYVIYDSLYPWEIGTTATEISDHEVTSYTVEGINSSEPHFFTVRVRPKADTDYYLHQWSALYSDSNTVTRESTRSNSTIIIDKIIASEEVLDTNSDTNVTIYYHASWSDDMSDVKNGFLLIGQDWYTTNSTGWVTYQFNRFYDTSYYVDYVFCDGVTTYNQTAPYLNIRWTYVWLHLDATEPSVWYLPGRWPEPPATQRMDVGSTDIKWTGVYNDFWPIKPFHGTIVFNDTVAKTIVGLYRYNVTEINDPEYGLNSYIAAPVDVIYDRIKLIDAGISSNSVKINQPVVVWCKSIYEYDGEEFNGDKGTLEVNNVNMTWSPTNQRWEKEFTSNKPETIEFHVTKVQDNLYGLTSYTDIPQRISCDWFESAPSPSPSPPPDFVIPEVAHGTIVTLSAMIIAFIMIIVKKYEFLKS